MISNDVPTGGGEARPLEERFPPDQFANEAQYGHFHEQAARITTLAQALTLEGTEPMGAEHIYDTVISDGP